jgi:hypothetical protein
MFCRPFAPEVGALVVGDDPFECCVVPFAPEVVALAVYRDAFARGAAGSRLGSLRWQFIRMRLHAGPPVRASDRCVGSLSGCVCTRGRRLAPRIVALAVYGDPLACEGAAFACRISRPGLWRPVCTRSRPIPPSGKPTAPRRTQEANKSVSENENSRSRLSLSRLRVSLRRAQGWLCPASQ